MSWSAAVSSRATCGSRFYDRQSATYWEPPPAPGVARRVVKLDPSHPHALAFQAWASMRQRGGSGPMPALE